MNAANGIWLLPACPQHSANPPGGIPNCVEREHLNGVPKLSGSVSIAPTFSSRIPYRGARSRSRAAGPQTPASGAFPARSGRPHRSKSFLRQRKAVLLNQAKVPSPPPGAQFGVTRREAGRQGSRSCSALRNLPPLPIPKKIRAPRRRPCVQSSAPSQGLSGRLRSSGNIACNRREPDRASACDRWKRRKAATGHQGGGDGNLARNARELVSGIVGAARP